MVTIRLSDLEGTLGAERVHLESNPSNKSSVLVLKVLAAAFINEVDRLPIPPREWKSFGEVKRVQALAMTEAETAAMYAEKAATKPVKP